MPICPDGSLGPCVPRSAADIWSNWVRMAQVDEFDLGTRYLASVHLITTTVMAVGYGDLFPANTLERLFCIVVQLVGAVCFGFILSCITAVLETSNPREVEHKKRMAEIKDWLHGRDLPASLRHRVWAHFIYLTSQRSAFKEENSMLLSLPSHVRNQLVERSHEQYVKAMQ
ncbi:unnamed protein product, partial [Polarella glacialis]